MAIYSTLFVATDADLDKFFPGWRAPLPRPVRAETRNPFTGEPLVYEQWDPGFQGKAPRRPSLLERHGRKVLEPLVAPEGEDEDYQVWLEDGAPELLRTFPHVAAKGVTGVELSAVAEVLVGRTVPPARFVDCPDGEGSAAALAAEAVPLLAGLGDKQLRPTAKKWRTALGDEFAPAVADLEDYLRTFRALAAEAAARGGHVFTHVPE